MTNLSLLNLGYFLVFLASADVVSLGGLTYYVWNRNTLDKLRKAKPATMDNLDSWFYYGNWNV